MSPFVPWALYGKPTLPFRVANRKAVFSAAVRSREEGSQP